MFKIYYPCDFCYLLLRSDGEVLLSVDFVGVRGEDAPCELLNSAFKQLELYFKGRLREFSVPLAVLGSAFERKVYQALREIPYGQTATYSQIATRVGRLNAARAVGNANAKNALPIFVPCHRVVGVNSLGGYSGGVGLAGVSPLDIKRYLLKLEGVDLKKFKG